MLFLDKTTHIDTRHKARFVDKDCGEWWAEPSNVIYGKNGHPKKSTQKQIDTCIKRYGK